MSSIDERIVEMQFDNARFEKGASDTISTLSGLDKALEKIGVSGDALKNIKAGDLDQAVNGIAENVENVSNKFGVLGAIGFTALQNLTTGAMNFGSKLITSMVDPIVEGGKKRALNIEQAQFQLRGLGLDVQATMAAANTAVKGTAFGLDEAARAASNLGASNIPLDQMATSLRAISGVAAMAGSSYTDIADVFQKVAGQGKVMGDDLNRLAARGVNAAATMGKAMGKSEAEIRTMVTKSQVSFADFSAAMDGAFGEHATKASETYTGALSNVKAALARIGAVYYTDKHEQMRRIFVALAPAIDKVAAVLKPLQKLWGEGMLAMGDAVANLLNKLDFTRAQRSTEGFAQAWRNVSNFLGQIFKPIGEAWKAVFPPREGVNQLKTLGEILADLTSKWKLNDAQVNAIRETFIKVFSVIKQGGQYAWEGLKLVWEGVKLAWGGMKWLWDWTMKVVDGFKAVSSGGSSGYEWFDKIAKVLIDIKDNVASGVLDFFDKLGVAFKNFQEGDTLGEKLSGLKEAFAGYGKWADTFMNSPTQWIPIIADGVRGAWELVLKVVKAVWEYVQPTQEATQTWLTSLVKDAGTVIAGLSLNDVIAIIQSGALVAGAITVVKAVKSIGGAFDSLGDMFGAIAGSFGQLTETLKTMQQDIKTNILLKVAISIGILVGAIWLLASIEPSRLLGAVGALATAAAILLISMKVMDKAIDEKSVAKINSLATGMLIFAGALFVMAKAVQLLGSMDFDSLARGLGAVVVSMAAMTGVILLITRYAGGSSMITASIGIAMMAGSLFIIAAAVEKFGKMDFKQLAQGLGSVVIALGVLAGAGALIGMGGGKVLAGAAGIILMAFALGMIYDAVYAFSAIDAGTLAKGLSLIAGILLGFAGVGIILSKQAGNMISGSVGILAMAGALLVLLPVIQTLGGMDPNKLAQGLIGIAGALTIFAVASAFMEKGAKGAGAIAMMSVSLAMLAGTIALLGSIPWDAMLRGLFGMAAGLAIFAAASAVFSNQAVATGAGILTGVLIGLSAAFLITATALLIIVAAIGLFGPAAALAAGGIVVLANACDSVKDKMGAVAGWSGILVLFGIAAVIAGAGAIILGAGLVILGVGLALITFFAVPAAVALQAFVEKIADLVQYTGQLILMGVVFAVLGAGMLILGAAAVILGAGILLAGAGMLLFGMGVTMVSMAMGGPGGMIEMITALINLLPVLGTNLALLFVNFVTTIAQNVPVILDLMGQMMTGLLTIILNNTPLILDVIFGLVSGMLDRLQPLIPKGIDIAWQFMQGIIQRIMDNIPWLAQQGTSMVVRLLNEIRSGIPQMGRAGTDLVVALIREVGAQTNRLVDEGFRLITGFLNSLANTITSRQEELRAAMGRVAIAILDGFTGGFASKAQSALQTVSNWGGQIADAARNALNINSPSKVFREIGKWTAKGFEVGIQENSWAAVQRSEDMANSAVDAANEVISTAKYGFSDINIDPTIRPVMDLTEVEQSVAQIGSMFEKVPTLDVSTSYAEAAGIAEAQENGDLPGYAGSGNTYVNLTQNNTSPESLDDVTIYRQTNNLMSKTKNELEDAK